MFDRVSSRYSTIPACGGATSSKVVLAEAAARNRRRCSRKRSSSLAARSARSASNGRAPYGRSKVVVAVLRSNADMAHADPVVRMSYAEYLELERNRQTKYEYLRGQVLAMAGGTLEHSRLASRISHLIRAGVGDRPCETFTSDAKIRVDATDLTTYPDVAVICGRLERSSVDAEAATNPVVLVEVLSDSTEAYDRGEKFAHYRRIASLREYLLVSQREPRLELFRRTRTGSWELVDAGSGGAVELESVGARLAVDDVFASALEA